MAIPWLASLPQKVNTEGFSFKAGDTVIRSDVDVGPQKVRRRFTAPIDAYTVSMDMTPDQMNDFREFYNVNLNGGVTEFEFTNPLTLAVENFRFSDVPTIVPVGSGGIHWRVTMSWEKLP